MVTQLIHCFFALHCIHRDQGGEIGSRLDVLREDQESVDLGQDEQGENAGLASSSSSEGDLELPTASGSSPRSPPKSQSQPPKPAPRQRPVIPPRPKEAAATNSSEGGLEPTPFDYTDPFQALEDTVQARGQTEERKKSSPPTAPKPSRPPKLTKPQLTVDASTFSASSVATEQTTASLPKVSEYTVINYLIQSAACMLQ